MPEGRKGKGIVLGLQDDRLLRANGLAAAGLLLQHCVSLVITSHHIVRPLNCAVAAQVKPPWLTVVPA
jgi:hypothetical protein